MTEPFAQRLADATIDRRRLKRRLVWWRAIAVIAVVVLVTGAASLSLGGGSFRAPGSYIARVPIAGVIEDNPALIVHLRRLGEDPRVAGVLISLNSPGGTFSGSEALYQSLRALSEAKPTAAVIGGMAASGGYMAAVATDYIVARAGSVTGSIGVIFQMPQVHRLLDNLGIDVATVRSGPLKAQPSPLEETSREARTATEALIDDLFQQFLGMVTTRRAFSADALAEIQLGGVFTGRRGLELGLVDVIGGEAVAQAWLESERGVAKDLPLFLRRETSDDTWLSDAIDQFENSTRFGGGSVLDGPWAIWHQ
jgi:protease-4